MHCTEEINALKSRLQDTDYQALKFAEGALTATEYAEMRQKRQDWRDRINALETAAGAAEDAS